MKIIKGKIVSRQMGKTAVVAVTRVVVHPVYKKRFRTVKKYHVHDPFGLKLGSIVGFVATKPYSKTKRWIVVPDIEKHRGAKLKRKK